jgi:hypothetical protein
MYKRGLATGILLSAASYILLAYCWDLTLYYTALFAEPLSTDSIEAGPFKITLSNATEWSTVFKMMITILGTYAGVKLINKVLR